MADIKSIQASTQFGVELRERPRQISKPQKRMAKSQTRAQSPIIRLLDIAISLAALVFLAPVMVIAALAVFFDDRGPVLFRQKRIGLHGREFYCLKFRSMRTNSAEMLETILRTNPKLRAEWESTQKFKSDPRITSIGHFLRKSSIDELPQLFNVLKGEMSLVGPRPIVAAEICKYGRSFGAYCSVLPGITGLWQVTGRSDVGYTRRVALDRTFARKTSVGLYLWILVMTVPAVLAQKGSY